MNSIHKYIALIYWNMIISLKRHFAYICVVLCSLLALLSSTLAKPSLSAFSIPTPFSNFPSLSALTQDFVERKHAEQMKSYRWVDYCKFNMKDGGQERCRRLPIRKSVIIELFVRKDENIEKRGRVQFDRSKNNPKSLDGSSLPVGDGVADLSFWLMVSCRP